MKSLPPPQKIAYILYNDLTLLDFVGIYDPISRLRSMGFLPELQWDLCAMTGTISDNFGLSLKATSTGQDLSPYDMIFIPGGFGTRNLQEDPRFIQWLQTAGSVPLKTSVCTGSLLLGAAGFLDGHRATTHFDEYESLRPYCRTVIRNQRIVHDGNIITAGAVATSLDLGLFLCEKWAGAAAKQAIQARMHYPG